MATTVDRKLLKRSVSLAKRATAKNPPALAHVRVGARAGCVTLEATNLETHARLELPCEGAPSDAAALVDPRALGALVRAGPDRVELDTSP